MKKVILTIIILGILSIGGGYFVATDHKDSNIASSNISNTNSNNILQQSNSPNSQKSSTTQNQNTNNSSEQNLNNSTKGNINSSKVSNNSSPNNNTPSNSRVAQNQLNISDNFSNSEISTLRSIIHTQEISPGSGTGTPIINLNYYSIVNGEKYYAEYINTIPETNWSMAGIPLLPDSTGNYSQLNFNGYINKYGQKISQSQFLEGTVSFNINNPTNLTNSDISNMIRKIAIMYVQYCGFKTSAQMFTSSDLTNYSGNIYVNVNNTKSFNGQTYYEVEYRQGQPMYVSLSGNIYVGQEHYLAKLFPIIPESNAYIANYRKHI